ncbi:MAG: hypothetical protein Kow0068_01620 [Marinilabiliales bacterium]
MKSYRFYIMIILLIIIFNSNCSKDELILNDEYLKISDLTHYCDCDRYIFSRKKVQEAIARCDSMEIKVKGYIVNTSSDFEDIILFSDTFSIFTLKDIRNEKYIKVGFDYNNQDIKNKIHSSSETDMCYINGIIKSFNEPPNYVVIYAILNSEDDIFFTNENNNN